MVKLSNPSKRPRKLLVLPWPPAWRPFSHWTFHLLTPSPTSYPVRGEFVIRVFSLTPSNWKWAIQDRVSLFESFLPSVSASSYTESLSAQLLRIGSQLHLPLHLLQRLPFSSAPPASPFLFAAGDDEVIIPFNAGLILLWALRVHVRDSNVDSLYPSGGVPSDPGFATPLSTSFASASGPSTVAFPSETTPSNSSSLEPSVAAVLSGLVLQVQDLASVFAGLQCSPSSRVSSVHPMAPSPDSLPGTLPVIPSVPPSSFGPGSSPLDALDLPAEAGFLSSPLPLPLVRPTPPSCARRVIPNTMAGDYYNAAHVQ